VRELNLPFRLVDVVRLTHYTVIVEVDLTPLRHPVYRRLRRAKKHPVGLDLPKPPMKADSVGILVFPVRLH